MDDAPFFPLAFVVLLAILILAGFVYLVYRFPFLIS